MVLQTAPSLPPAQQVFCRVIAPLHVRGNAYDFAVDLFHQEGGHVIGGHLQADAGVGAPGVVYNVVDENTFDFVAFKWVRETTRCGIVSRWSRNDTCNLRCLFHRVWTDINIIIFIHWQIVRWQKYGYKYKRVKTC